MTKLRADLHNHLRTSSNLQPEDFNRAIDIARERLGPDGTFSIANFGDKRYEKFAGLRGYERVYVGENNSAVYVPSKKVLVVKAQEVPTKQGHLLVLGLGFEQHLKPNQDLEYTIREADEKTTGEAAKVADHPFFLAGIGPYLQQHPKLLEQLDGIEIHNGEAIFGNANKKARDFYNQVKSDYPNLGALSSSDGHSFYELGKSWTEIDFPDIDNPAQFVPSLKQAIRATNSQTPYHNHVSYAGFIDHALDLAFITKVAPRIGMAKMFETDRPEEKDLNTI